MAKAISALNTGDKVKFGSIYGNPIIWKVADKNHSGYPSNSVTLITDSIIKIMGFDAREPSNSDTNRKNYGNNRYSLSNINQWLNSASSGTLWYSATHAADAAPTSGEVTYNPYRGTPGFLYSFTADERNSIQSATVTVAKNTVTDGGGSESATAKVFLPSTTEVGLANENGIAEGSKLAIFSDNASRVAYPTASAVSNSDYTNTSLNTSAGWHYWLRTPNSGYSHYVRIVDSVGTLSNSGAYDGYGGLRPALNLLSSILVSDSLDSDGAYAVTFNVAPTISGSDGALGSFSASAPSQSYTVNDANGGTVTVTEKIDGAISDQFTASLGSARTFAIAPQWQQLTNGSHTLEVAASDGTLSAVRTWTFTKSVTGFEVVSDVFPADAMPTRCVINIPITSRAVPAGGELKVYACNNGNDASPAWEEITNYAFAGLIYSFTNTDKTDAAWGVRVKVIGSRGTAGSAVWFSAIGGAFE